MGIRATDGRCARLYLLLQGFDAPPPQVLLRTWQKCGSVPAPLPYGRRSRRAASCIINRRQRDQRFMQTFSQQCEPAVRGQTSQVRLRLTQSEQLLLIPVSVSAAGPLSSISLAAAHSGRALAAQDQRVHQCTNREAWQRTRARSFFKRLRQIERQRQRAERKRCVTNGMNLAARRFISCVC